ncbi:MULTISPECIES: TspO/MBR family protein [unclassified Sphingomonas]|uniref:TspO/MBR family protein n=2 Tax=unclassified Sphingomonas TaxID=196159 RepID=UPI000FED90C7|nr:MULTISPECIES: TspO/MBR family protein [unclassified Sphingomonas]RKE53228.1 TspO/MBR related protein [Sphingomonas sp. PP-CC-1A-547]TCM09722.1 TspO/MBR related protein [Sphingomonas sp. PP-CC-3G-468]
MGGIASKGQLRMSFLRWAVVTVPLILLLGFLSGRSVSVGSENAWYMALAKPALNPPGWVFPVVWTTLYILIGLALAMILNARGARLRGLAVALFVGQFLLNLAWTPMFFGAHKIGLSVLVIVAMLALSIAATFVFARIRPAAAWLMVPYMVWISFAGVLAFSIGQLNPGAETLAPAPHTSQML